MKDSFDQLLSDFGQETGLTDLHFDEREMCHLRVDETLTITLRRDVHAHRLIFVGTVAEKLPDNVDLSMVKEWLAMNIALLQDSGSPVLSFENNTGLVLLQRCLPLERLDFPYFKIALNDFIELQKQWTERFQACAVPN
jgi:hypothetical protein